MYDDWHSLDFYPIICLFSIDIRITKSNKATGFTPLCCTTFDARSFWWKALSFRKNELIFMLEKIKIWLKIGKCALCHRHYHADCIRILRECFFNGLLLIFTLLTILRLRQEKKNKWNMKWDQRLYGHFERFVKWKHKRVTSEQYKSIQRSVKTYTFIGI